MTGHALRSFIPSQSLGAGIDGHEEGDIARLYTRPNLAAMKSAGLKPLTYRLRTELGIEAWHWNPRGHWSDSQHRQGYWTSDAEIPQAQTSRFNNMPAIEQCYGYRLPRRGSTIDQANNDGYSRVDDGNLQSFWKSNPYLDRHFTGEPNRLHPQWLVIDLQKKQALSALRIWWGTPFAVRYIVEYWSGKDVAGPNDEGAWRAFPHGTVLNGRGGNGLLRLCETPVRARFVRLTMTESSGGTVAQPQDVRDGLGYAIREISLGTLDQTGKLRDAIRHSRSNSAQTRIFASSTDPWHRASDRDTSVEQPGFDRVFRSGLTNGLPMLTPVGMLYDTPENAVAELRYLRSRGYPVQRVELGEEPDGQYVAPDDYGALYIQWARALHQVDPSLQLGGPSFQTTLADITAWPTPPDKRTWLWHVLNYLHAHGRSADFDFCSFEWYPFDNVCAPTMPQLLGASDRLAFVMKRLRQSGLPANCPLLITEYGYSAFAARAEVDRAGALFNADMVGRFLSEGGATAYLYGYEPDEMIQELPCKAPGDLAWGNNMLFLSDDQRRIQYRTATYYGACLLTGQWLGAPGETHKLYPISCNLKDREGHALVSAYAVHRPDGLWAVLLINKDKSHTWPVRIRFNALQTAPAEFSGPLDIYRFGAAQYLWHPNKDEGYPAPDLPPGHTVTHDPANFVLQLPPYSLCVLRGRGP